MENLKESDKKDLDSLILDALAVFIEENHSVIRGLLGETIKARVGKVGGMDLIHFDIMINAIPKCGVDHLDLFGVHRFMLSKGFSLGLFRAKSSMIQFSYSRTIF